MLENHLLISTSNNMIELLPRHPPLLRSYITFNCMSPVTFDGSGQVPIDYYYPVCYPRSSNRPDPNDARLLLLNHSADLNQKNKYIYPWQSPSWTLNVWGQYILNTRLSGSHGGSTEPDSLNKDVHSLDHPPRMTTKKRLRDDEKTRIANIMGTIKTPRDSLGLRIQLDPIQAQSTRYTNLMSSTSSLLLFNSRLEHTSSSFLKLKKYTVITFYNSTFSLFTCLVLHSVVVVVVDKIPPDRGFHFLVVCLLGRVQHQEHFFALTKPILL